MVTSFQNIRFGFCDIFTYLPNLELQIILVLCSIQGAKLTGFKFCWSSANKILAEFVLSTALVLGISNVGRLVPFEIFVFL